jgi:hypothetical protein
VMPVMQEAWQGLAQQQLMQQGAHRDEHTAAPGPSSHHGKQNLGGTSTHAAAGGQSRPQAQLPAAGWELVQHQHGPGPSQAAGGAGGGMMPDEGPGSFTR